MKKKYLLLIVLLCLCSQQEVFAQGDLMVYPTRLVFDVKNDRIQIINLNNVGKDTTTYNLSYIENKMLENGHLKIQVNPEPEQKIASPYLRFYPRTITLAPGETQVVKVQLVKTSDLVRGEYRSHLYFRPVPKPEALENKTLVTSEGISISLKPVYGVSIANIVHIGNPQFEIRISDMALEQSADQATFLSLTLNREGDASSYGDIAVEYVSIDGKRTIVAEKKGLAVYTPGTIRKNRLKLKNVEGVNYKSGKLIVKYLAQGGDKTVIAESSLEL